MMTRRNDAAFTLIEIVLALAIIAFALVALMGMLPIGINTFHDAKRNTVDARIVQQLTAMLQLGDRASSSTPSSTFNKNSTTANTTTIEYYFDSYGNQLGTSLEQPKDVSQIIYTAQISTNGISGSTANVTLPGADASSPYLTSYTVLITDLPSNLSDRFSYTTFPELKHQQHTLMYTALVSQSSGA